MGSPRFYPGEIVRVRTGDPSRHYRTPRYVQGKRGRVHSVRGPFRNPESLAYAGDGLPAQYLYKVAFAQSDLWPGYAGAPDDRLFIDIYEHWLDDA